MDDESSIGLRIPQPDDFDDVDVDAGSLMASIPVATSVVDSGIDWLQGFLAQWKHDEGTAYDALARAAPAFLSGLMSAFTAYYHTGTGPTRLLVRQIAWFCRPSFSHTSELDALRRLSRDPDTGYIAEALIALLKESERRHKERLPQGTVFQQEPAGQQEQKPAGQDDAGWDF